MTRFGFFTFNPHANDIFLNQELINTLYPILEKFPKYALVIEKPETPGEHFHLIFEFNGDTSQKVKQKIENKAVALFIKNRLTKTMTIHQNAFDYQLIENTEEELMYTVGYIYKDGNEYKSKGFDAEYVTKCIQFYHVSVRNKAKIDPSKGWKVLGLRNAHAEIESFAEKNEISIDDKHLYLRMKEQKISFCQISQKQQSIIHDELIVANKLDNDFAVALATRNIIQGEHNSYFKERYDHLLKTLKWQIDSHTLLQQTINYALKDYGDQSPYQP